MSLSLCLTVFRNHHPNTDQPSAPRPPLLRLLIFVDKFFLSFFFNIYLIILKIERERVWQGGAEGERENPGADSMLSAEPGVGLTLMTPRS